MNTNTKRRRGRPVVAADQKRTEYVGVRLNRGELVRLYALARLVRMDVGEFIRTMTVGNFGITENTPSH